MVHLSLFPVIPICKKVVHTENKMLPPSLGLNQDIGADSFIYFGAKVKRMKKKKINESLKIQQEAKRSKYILPGKFMNRQKKLAEDLISNPAILFNNFDVGSYMPYGSAEVFNKERNQIIQSAIVEFLKAGSHELTTENRTKLTTDFEKETGFTNMKNLFKAKKKSV